MPRQNLDLTLSFVGALDRSVTEEDVRRVLDKHLNRYGITTYVAGVVYGPATRPREQLAQSFLYTMPGEWRRRYTSEGYWFKDPTIPLLGVARAPYTWSEAMARAGDDAGARRVMGEAGEFGMAQGITVPLATLDGDLAGFSFSGPRVEIAPSDLGMLDVMAAFAFARLLLIRGVSRKRSPTKLGPREREALQWTAAGKTAWEVGEVMGISKAGVDYHLRSARTKLSTSNTTQSVAMALRLGLIT